MIVRGRIYEPEYKPQFTGHETFALRYGWLKKAYEAIAATEHKNENKGTFLNDDAIANFGVGKNMVSSIRHWANAVEVIKDKDAAIIETTELGKKLFGENGFDCYMEHPTTLWLIHWKLAASARKTTWHWVFNYLHGVAFDRQHIIKGLSQLVSDRKWRVAATTMKNDVSCFISTYAAQKAGNNSSHDDVLESPLIELGLIKATGRDSFRFVRGAKPTLGTGMFVYSLLDFWDNYSPATATLSLDAITHAPGSPGRVFLLDEDDLVTYLANIADYTANALHWSESTGLRQVMRDAKKKTKEPLSYIDIDYATSQKRSAA